jgi:hypothetical protein
VSTHVGTILATLASATVVVVALAALVRAVFKFALNIRDNTKATQELSGKLEDLTASIDGRFDKLVARVDALERRQR